ncbi:MAG: cation-translocating P-type ATPase [Pseudomonadota bacterium]|nr:cation-translocating P-type ATPase [Pseudomonadota bacterium]
MVSEKTTKNHPWHTRGVEAVQQHWQVDPATGLPSARVEERLQEFGSNEIRETGGRGPVRILLSQFADFMIMVLIAAAVVSGLVGEPEDTIAIVVIVLLNAIIGAAQEYRAERAVAALKRLAAPEARVMRDGSWQTLPAVGLVPGDIVEMVAGDVVPADIRLFESGDLEVDESALTGESQTVGKRVETLSTADLPVGDRRNMTYKGTVVTRGRARGLVVATAMQTELGRVATLLGGAAGGRTPLQQRLAVFGRRLAIAVLGICVVIFVTGVLRGESATLMFLTAVSLAVAAIPEALPAVVTVALAFGAAKMVRRQALVRRLPAVETLGSVTYICADKTGTLTENRMRTEMLWSEGEQRGELPESVADVGRWTHFGRAMALNSEIEAGQSGEIVGDPTEVALFEAAKLAHYDKAALLEMFPQVAVLAFDSDRQMMTTIHRVDDHFVAYTKGAPEQIVGRCRDRLADSGPQPLDAEGILAQAESMADQGYRVLAYAQRLFNDQPSELISESVEGQLSFLGLVGLIDPPREGVAQAVQDCLTAGITPVMITGDHPGTARAIAHRLGIMDHDGEVMTGAELAKLTPEEFTQRVTHVQVYARMSPEQKIAIVDALESQGEYVAMTGDGVNDAPALKRAAIGVAMGQKGTDVAREAAEMVLLDDNFTTIVTAVREGRRIFDNIRKFIKYTMTSNSGEIWTLFLAPFLGLPIPLLPIQILWINLVTDGLPGLALAAEPQERGIMRRPPRSPNETVFAYGIWQHIIWVGLLIGVLSIGSQAWAYHSGSPQWQTVVFTVLTFSQLVHVLVIRSERDSLITLGLFSNPSLLGAVLLTVGLQLSVIYIPALNEIFHTAPLTLTELAVCFTLPLVIFVAVEAEKWFVRNKGLYRIVSREERQADAVTC